MVKATDNRKEQRVKRADINAKIDECVRRIIHGVAYLEVGIPYKATTEKEIRHVSEVVTAADLRKLEWEAGDEVCRLTRWMEANVCTARVKKEPRP